ncbi:hypothetical protein ACJX0J_007825, partial [Zea mays]
SIIEVLGIVNQGQQNPSRDGGLVANISEGWDPLFEEVKIQLTSFMDTVFPLVYDLVTFICCTTKRKELK